MTPPVTPLRICVVHSFYSSRQPSGENVVVEAQVAALRRAGHEVHLVSRSTDALEKAPSYPARAAFRAATGRGDSPLAEVLAFEPDIVHVHNLFPNLGRRWLHDVSDRLVLTLHNYRPLCPAGTLFRDGHACTLCPDAGSARAAVVHACFKDSRAQTLPVALGTRFADDPVLAAPARLVTLNDEMRATYEAHGVPGSRLVTVPNFVEAGAPGHGAGGSWLFVGRISRVKGVFDLLARWPAGHRLIVVGTGPDLEEARALAGDDVEFTGQLPGSEVRRLMGDAVGLVFPSLWPEGLPTVYLEALASGTPVLAWPQSIVGSLVAEHGTGRVVPAEGSSLAAHVSEAAAAFPGLRAHVREVYEANYTERAWSSAIESTYRGLLNIRPAST